MIIETPALTEAPAKNYTALVITLLIIGGAACAYYNNFLGFKDWVNETNKQKQAASFSCLSCLQD